MNFSKYGVLLNMNSAIIVAAGRGTRLGGIKKQFLEIEGKSVLKRSVEKFVKAGISDIVISTMSEDLKFVEEMFSDIKDIVRVVEGGATRQQSVTNAFNVCSKGGIVLIHDAARPFVSIENIKNVISMAEKTGAATLAVSSTDTVKFVENNLIKHTLDRNKIYLVQTPQAFSKELYKKALKEVVGDYTDDCQLIEKIGVDVTIVEGSRDNIKITTPEDLEYAKILAKV